MEKILLVGAGGHCKVIISIILKNGNLEIYGISDEKESLHGKSILDYKISFSEKNWCEIRKHCKKALVAFGNIDIPYQRKKIFEKLKKNHFKLPIIISKDSIIADDVKIGEGTVIMPGVVINPGTVIGKNCILNTGCIIDHDCNIGDHTHIAPGVTCSGGVLIGELCHIGTGVTIIQSINIGNETLVAAGAVVIKNIPKKSRVKGVPARHF